MMFRRYLSIQTRNLYPFYQSTLNNTLKCLPPRVCYLLSARFNSIDKSSKNQTVEVDQKSDGERQIKLIDPRKKENDSLDSVDALDILDIQRISTRLQVCDHVCEHTRCEETLNIKHEQGDRVPDPDLIEKHHWDELVKIKSKSARGKFYNYLFQIQMSIENNKLKKDSRKKLRESSDRLEPKQEEPHPHIDYGLGKATFLLRINESAIDAWRNNRLRQAMQFGEKLIFDCSYDQYMNSREAKNAAKQLMLCFAENRKHREPFDLHFCNANFNADTMKQLERYIPTMRNIEFPLNVHEGSYLDLFPREKLTYITQDCRNDLKEFDPHMTYIIAAMVDKRNSEPLSLAKAKRLNLKMARLPLEKYLNWNGRKSLTLDQMMKIMLELKKTRNWNEALKYVPKRKIRDY